MLKIIFWVNQARTAKLAQVTGWICEKSRLSVLTTF